MQLVQEHLSVVQCQRLWAAPRARGTPCGQDPGTQLAPQPPHRVCLRGNSFPFLVYLLLRFSCLGVLDSTPKRRLIKHFLMMFFFHFFSLFLSNPVRKALPHAGFSCPVGVPWSSRSWGDAARWLQGAVVPTGMLTAPALGPSGAHPAFGAGRGRATTRCYFQERGLLCGLGLQGQQEDNLPS